MYVSWFEDMRSSIDSVSGVENLGCLFIRDVFRDAALSVNTPLASEHKIFVLKREMAEWFIGVKKLGAFCVFLYDMLVAVLSSMHWQMMKS